MKRKMISIASIACVVALVTFVAPVRSVALDILSIFRVNNLKTITITMQDLQEGMQNMQALQATFANEIETGDHQSPIDVPDMAAPNHYTLTDEDDFNGFNVNLPKAWKDKTVSMMATEAATVPFTVNTDVSNDILAKLGSSVRLGDMGELSVSIPAAFVAEYEDVTFGATQMPLLTGASADKQALRDALLSLPQMPTNLRNQLAAIDADTRDVYLPVLVGVGREVDIGGNTGYLYSLSDVKAFGASLPQDFFAAFGEENAAIANYEMKTKLENNEAHPDNVSALIWTKNGVLYTLVADKTDGELTALAKSVH